ncbi:MAG: MarR family transcriptional regulator [Deltaproteobacteria bacterium]|nr:MarR family transcriptional regulator [Deltaproteobacteria bacterium]
MQRLFETRMPVPGVSLAMRDVLDLLHEAGAEGATVPFLARILTLDRQSVQPVVDRLASAGLVVRAPNPHHRRSVLLRLTKDGAEVIRLVRTRELGEIPLMFAPFTQAEIVNCLRVVEHLLVKTAIRAAEKPARLESPSRSRRRRPSRRGE